MSDSISRKGAIELIKDQAGCNSCHSYDGVRCRACTYEDVMDLIDCMPDSYGWIPCSERLPKPNRHNELNVDVYYLAQTEFGDMIVASYNESHEGKTLWEQMYSYRIFDDEIVAWMPLPEPYKGE